MIGLRARAATTVVLAVSLLAAACGGGDDSGSTAATVDEGVKAGVESATGTGGGSAAPASHPESMEDWEELWATERAAIVKRIKDNNWGKSADGKTLTGPEGYTIDLSKCGGGGWSDTEGLTDTEIKIGHTIAQSGAAADYGNSTRTIRLVFDYYGNNGALNDSTGKTRKVNYIVKDDGYDPARTIPAVDELLDSEKVFALWALGTPNVFKIYDKLNQRCVPSIFMATAHPAFGDPVNHPWTTGAPQTSYSTEAVMWGTFIDQRINEFPDKVKVAALITNNDFGRIYDAAFKAYIAQSPNKDKIEYVSETVEPQTPSVTDPMTTLAAENPDFFIAMVFAAFCTQTVVTAAENGLHESAKYLMQPATCTGSAFVNKEKVGGDGSAADGWWLMNPAFKDYNDPAQFGDAYVAWARQLMQSNGIDSKLSSSFGNGFNYAWGMVQAIRIAGELNGGLNRSNLILATRSLDMTNPVYLPGIRFHLDGNRDGFAQEGGVFQQWDAANQVWVVKGNVIDLDGKSRVCAWDASAAVCR